MMKRFLVPTVVIALLTWGASAQAALLAISGGTLGTTSSTAPNKNDVLGGGVSYLDNATLSVTQDVTLEFWFLGSESGYNNTLRLSNGFSYTEPSNGGQTYPSPWPGNLLTSINVSAGSAVPMYFTSSGFSGSVAPGTGVGRSIAFAYLTCLTGATCAETTDATNMVLFMFDDGGAGPDDNHDDFVGYIIARPKGVPEPGSLGLLGLGLTGLWLGTRRRRSS